MLISLGVPNLFSKSESRNHTLSDLVDRYLKEVLPYKQKLIRDQTCQLNWWKKEIGPHLLANITPAVIVEARNKLLQQDAPRGTKRSPASANRYLSALSCAFTVGMNEWNWLEENPFRKVKKFKEPRGRTRFLSTEELDRLLKACKQSRCPYLELIVTLAVSTGMRHGEIVKLSWETVNLKDSYLILTETKNGTQRRVPLHGKSLELFKLHNRIRRIDTPLVFPGTTPEKPLDIRSAWRFARRQAKLEDFRFHDLRHSAASYLAMSGATTHDIAEILGHKTLQMVKRYAHLSDSHTSQVVARMNERVFSQISERR